MVLEVLTLLFCIKESYMVYQHWIYQYWYTRVGVFALHLQVTKTTKTHLYTGMVYKHIGLNIKFQNRISHVTLRQVLR